MIFTHPVHGTKIDVNVKWGTDPWSWKLTAMEYTEGAVWVEVDATNEHEMPVVNYSDPNECLTVKLELGAKVKERPYEEDDPDITCETCGSDLHLTQECNGAKENS